MSPICPLGWRCGFVMDANRTRLHLRLTPSQFLHVLLDDLREAFFPPFGGCVSYEFEM